MLYMKISKFPMLVSSVFEICFLRCFYHIGVATLDKFLSRHAYQDATNQVFETRKDYFLEIMKFYGFKLIITVL